jgi:hypothetical protein
MGKCSNIKIVRYGVNVNEKTTPKSNWKKRFETFFSYGPMLNKVLS